MLSIKTLASGVFMSESRLRHLFKKEVGTSLHQFLLWAKLKSSLNDLIQGKNITESGMKSGFSDSSHYSQTIVKNFGVTPSEFIRANQKIEVVFLDDDPLDFVIEYYDGRPRPYIRLSAIGTKPGS